MIGYGPKLTFMGQSQEPEEHPITRALRESSYPVQLENEIAAAQGLSDEFMKGYIQAYESHGLPKIRRFIQRILGGSEECEGNGDPVRVNAYRQVLEDRLNSE